MEYLIYFLAGGLGSLLKDIVNDGKLVLPKKIDGELILGFIGGVVVGGCAGMAVDNSPITAFFVGYAGTQGIESLLSKTKNAKTEKTQDVEALIRSVAKLENVDPELAVRVATCESNLNPQAINVNPKGSRDRGIFQINDKYHPEVTDEEAFDIVCSTKFFCNAFKAGNLSWWNASKTCWDV